MRFFSTLFAMVLMLHSSAGEYTPRSSSMADAVERLDPRIDALIPPGAVIEELATGFSWTEGPLWLKDSQALIFSDVPGNAIHRWTPGSASTSVFLRPSGSTETTTRKNPPGSNGLTRDPTGRIVMCEHGDRRVTRLNADGTKTVLADRFDGKRLNSPNDLCLASDGTLFFTDPTYGLEKGDKDPKRELPFSGVFAIGTDGTVTLLTSALTKPNGIALSPDERTLYITQSDPKRAIVMAYTRQATGAINAGRVVYDATPLVKAGLPGITDGLKVSNDGTLFVTGPGGVLVITPDGTLLGTIRTGSKTANCAWGPDGWLYLTAHRRILRIKTTAIPASLP